MNIFKRKHKKPKMIELGIIDFVDNLGICKLVIYTKEYTIPHFHIIGIDNHFEACVRIFENMYYSHNGKYTDILTINQCKQLDEYLKTLDDTLFNVTVSYWRNIVIIWDCYLKYGYKYRNIVHEQPDYSNMRYFKDDDIIDKNLIISGRFPPVEKHTDLECYIIGTIDLGDELGECDVKFYTVEGPIPHFHIINKDGTFEVCVRIYENMYYSHEGKYSNILNYKQCKKLDEFLRKYNDKFYAFTNWWLINNIWSGTVDNDNYIYHNKTNIQPDYTNLKEYKDTI